MFWGVACSLGDAFQKKSYSCHYTERQREPFYKNCFYYGIRIDIGYLSFTRITFTC